MTTYIASINAAGSPPYEVGRFPTAQEAWEQLAVIRRNDERDADPKLTRYSPTAHLLHSLADMGDSEPGAVSGGNPNNSFTGLTYVVVAAPPDPDPGPLSRDDIERLKRALGRHRDTVQSHRNEIADRYGSDQPAIEMLDEELAETEDLAARLGKLTPADR